MMALYVYALTDRAAASFVAAGRSITFIDAGGVFAAATQMETMPELSEAALSDQHDVVGRIAARVDAILPARFGSLIDRGELERVVALRRGAIVEALALVAGCEQMTVRVFAAGDERRPRVPAPAANGTAYLRQRADAERSVHALLGPLSDAARPFVRAERSARAARGVAATLYHLIARGDSTSYRERLDALRDARPAPDFVVSGPWPPFAFAPELWT